MNSAESRVRPIRVLFVMDKLGYAGGVSHGPAQYLRNVLPRFDPEVVQASICILSPWHAFAKDLEAVGFTPLFLEHEKWDPRSFRDLLSLMREQNIDIVQLFGMKACVVGRVAARIAGSRVIVHVRDMTPMGPVLQCFQRRLAKWTDLTIAISGSVKNFAVEELGFAEDRVDVLYNPIVVSEFSRTDSEMGRTIREQLQIPRNAKVMGIIGRLHPDKGHEWFLRLLPQIVSREPKAVLLVVGDGELREACEALVETLEVSHAVRFVGHRRDIVELLSAIDLVVMPSRREGFGLAALEAMTAGVPVVASRVGGLAEIVVDGATGFLVDPDDGAGFVNRVIRLLEDPQLCATQRVACAEHVRQFAVDAHVETLTNVYRTLVP